MPLMMSTQSLMLMIPAILFTLYAQSKVKSTFNKYLQVRTLKGFTGSQVARGILDRNGMHDVNVERSQGSLSDHYDPRSKVVRLSPEVYERSSVASVSVAAHEVGHALQHAGGYLPLTIRNNFVLPIANFGSKTAWIFILGGFLFRGEIMGVDMLDLGILLFAAAVVFQIVTLPVEFNASTRAVALLEGNGYLEASEMPQSKKVLNAAALTYVASMAAAVLQLARLIMLRNRR
ncbi:zinc metallopeptidase [Isachenkonia alkalipeptolytica]|uniref:Zinc metallopeptidase n=2 Tax=Isachenkonia alkalipeptolytica TaxID=2565777 RepID=A0AA44BFL9_9CLOT|nr:zinc metallopeptidase [Isachenkonia alkalipeptolytica]NBG89130.1 zinc metallopeptidase [Isachenkonia alkalipeptolytica]